MYAQIPPEAAEPLQGTLVEGKVFLVKKIFFNVVKLAFRVVESRYMMQFTKFRTVALQPGLEDDFPYCIYSHSMFADIPMPASITSHFIGWSCVVFVCFPDFFS